MTPTGWIDILALRRADGALLMIEVKTAIPDVGALLRQVGFYERESAWAARRMGWLPTTIALSVVCLDSAEILNALARNRDHLATEFPTAPGHLLAPAISAGSRIRRCARGVATQRIQSTGVANVSAHPARIRRLASEIGIGFGQPAAIGKRSSKNEMAMMR